MAQDAQLAAARSHLEVAMIGREPLIDHDLDLEGAVVQAEAPRRLLAAIAGVAFDGDGERLQIVQF